ncbi:MAG: acyl-CoA dehydrogenase [Gammaproteobacteria bacterium]|jgi:alkylation response protein AidB-like acyl-CoA dehydrogenase|nr:acyl-CoA dehydrogenase [Gammaproteobacteria bacterium]MCH1551530.1 acyl-CoA dehydrogenase family protein [Pseudomonadales bacterium]
MNIEFSAEDEVFREEVKNFLSTNLTDEMRREAERTTTVFADKDLAMKWQEILVEKGWAVPAWPVEHGGVAWTPNQKYIWGQECAKSHAPGLIPLGLRMLAPVLFKYGTPEQKAEYLPKILSGEQYWCQGYSEPGSGSDLSSLKTSAVKDGDDYVVNGTKIWTTHAHFADHIFCLVRTDTGVKPQAGITFLLIPLDMPGITVKPIITIADDHEVNQVFFDDVRVPQSNRVGPENEGWTVAKYLLEFERGGGGAAAGIRESIESLKSVASKECDGQMPLMNDPSFAGRVAELEIRNEALHLQELMTLEKLSKGGSPGPSSSLAKNSSVDINQEINTLKLEAVHYYGLPNANKISLNGHNDEWVGESYSETVTSRYINSRASSVFGGSREVQKNIIAKAVLGL